jgi:phage shock protein E
MQVIPCDEVRALIREGAQLVDVRTPMEFHQGALPGALNIPVQMIREALDELDMTRPVLVYCRSGQRSAYARMWLQSMGFSDVYNLGAAYAYLDCITGRESETAAA